MAADSESVVDLYQKAEKIYPREIAGRFQTLRQLAVWVLLGLFYVLPWLQWGERQMVLFDLPARKFYVFGLVFWPQDFIFLAGLLVIAAFSLFFFTSIGGRLWCGYACPQTVWTEVYFKLEQWAEGGARKRKKLADAPWSLEKLRKKATKQFLFISFAFWTGLTFVGFFTPIRELVPRIPTWDVSFWEGFWVLFYGLATYGNAGYLREQVCKYMCPYARFQGAMFDRDTLVIAYDEERGEPRGARSRKIARDDTSLGDCIDCSVCVQVCPTGIDIRKGLQYECIACAACIDACDEVMDKMEYPRGLIRYTTQNAVEGKRSRVLRPRTIMYAVILTLICGAWVYGVATRPQVGLDVLRDRNAMFQMNSPTRVENSYTLRVSNRAETPRKFEIKVAGLPGIEMLGDTIVSLEGGEIGSRPLVMTAPISEVSGREDITVTVTALDDPNVQSQRVSRFFGPGPGLRR